MDYISLYYHLSLSPFSWSPLSRIYVSCFAFLTVPNSKLCQSLLLFVLSLLGDELSLVAVACAMVLLTPWEQADYPDTAGGLQNYRFFSVSL